MFVSLLCVDTRDSDLSLKVEDGRELDPPKDGLMFDLSLPKDDDLPSDPPNDGRESVRSLKEGDDVLLDAERESVRSLKVGADLWLPLSLKVGVGLAEFEPNDERESSRFLDGAELLSPNDLSLEDDSVRSTLRPRGVSFLGFA